MWTKVLEYNSIRICTVPYVYTYSWESACLTPDLVFLTPDLVYAYARIHTHTRKTTFWVHCILSPTSKYIVHPKNSTEINPLHLLASPNQKFHEKKHGSCLRSPITNIEKIRPNKNISKPRQRIIIQSWPTWILLFWVPNRWSKQLQNRMNKKNTTPWVFSKVYSKNTDLHLWWCWWMMLAVPSYHIYVRWNNTQTGIMWLVVPCFHLCFYSENPFLDMGIPSNPTKVAHGPSFDAVQETLWRARSL